MRRVWATIVTVWAIVAIVGFLAWTRPPATPQAAQVVPTRMVITGRNGVSHVVVRQVVSAHATTQTSPAAGGSTALAAAPAIASPAGTVRGG